MVISEIVARGHASAPAILAENQRAMTFGSLGALIDRTVLSLNQLGIGREDRVAVVLPNGSNLATSFLAISAGAGFAPLNPAYSAAEFEYFLRDLGAVALVTQPDFCSAAIEAARSLANTRTHVAAHKQRHRRRFHSRWTPREAILSCARSIWRHRHSSTAAQFRHDRPSQACALKSREPRNLRP